MKIIFLDFDGVLNCENFFRKVTKGGTEFPQSDAGVEYMIDPEAVAQVNRICDETGAWVVISSTWRYGRTLTQLHKILRNKGFTGKLAGTTPKGGDHPRGQQIQNWLGEIIQARYVILDDDSDMLPEQFPFFVQTTEPDGLTPELADKAIAILNQ